MERPRNSGWIVVGIVLVALPPLYLLSVGPAVWLHDRGWISDGVATVYVPLEWLAERSPTFGGVIEQYVDFWSQPQWAPAPANAPLPPTPAPPPLPSPGTAPELERMGVDFEFEF
jgi:hypothetical protein